MIHAGAEESQLDARVQYSLQALALWPRSAELLAMLAEAGEAARSSARLRRDLSAARQVRLPLPASRFLHRGMPPLRPGPVHGHRGAFTCTSLESRPAWPCRRLITCQKYQRAWSSCHA